ncbi:MAG: transcription antitermination factor NusB [Actinobacteria bacterium]|nr:transcription antitermination factor NusB [Cyanobacteriota bacterium]MCL6087153.1 transcription antitermination factor NusB [Actinomycetota bacterium]
MIKTTRRRSRIKAVILLYQCDLLKKDAAKIISSEMDFHKHIDDFTIKLVMGVEKNKNEIDNQIRNVVENWTLDRISIIDRNILRMAIYEMMYEDDIPLKVSVDEAIEISKILGQKDETPKFVNGILGKILTNLNKTSHSEK